FGYSLAKALRRKVLPNHLDHLLYRGVFAPPVAALRTCLAGENSFSDSSYLAPNVCWQRTGRRYTLKSRALGWVRGLSDWSKLYRNAGLPVLKKKSGARRRISRSQLSAPSLSCSISDG